MPPQEMVLVDFHRTAAELSSVAHESLDGVGFGGIDELHDNSLRMPLPVDAAVAHHADEPVAHMIVASELLVALEQLDERVLRCVAGRLFRVQHVACDAEQGVAVVAHGILDKLVAFQRKPPPSDLLAGRRMPCGNTSYFLLRLGTHLCYRNRKYFEKGHIWFLNRKFFKLF